MTPLGIIGAGKLGVALSRVAVEAGFDVMVAGTVRENTELILSVMAPGAKAGTTAEVAAFAPVVVLALPLHRFRELDAAAFAGKILVDAINYWEPVDGPAERYGAVSETSRHVQDHFCEASVVKSLNQLGYHDVEERSRPRGASDRLGVAVAGDDADAVAAVAKLVDELGFDAVLAGSLSDGRVLGPGGPGFGATLTARELRGQLESRRTTG